jgi:ABC-2 type transport system permease protein
MNLSRLWAVARKEAIQLRRDPRSLGLAFVLPAFMLLFFGYAITMDVRHIRMSVLDQSRSQESRQLVEAFLASGYFELAAYLVRYGDIDQELGTGRARLVLVIPPDFQRDLAAGRRAVVQVLLDGGDANTATIAQNYADAIITGFGVDVVLRGRRLSLPVAAESRAWYNETLESRNMIVPGLVAVIMSIIAALLTALTIAREWERGTMEQLAATPVHRNEVVLGKLLPYVGIGMLDVAVALLVGATVFDVPLRGDAALLTVMTLLFLVGALGLGMFVSAAVKSQVLATQVAMLATYMPALLLSGFIFTIATMPVALRALTWVVPARYYVTVSRGILLKGVGADVLWPQGIAMIVFATVGLGLAINAFKKELA